MFQQSTSTKSNPFLRQKEFSDDQQKREQNAHGKGCSSSGNNNDRTKQSTDTMTASYSEIMQDKDIFMPVQRPSTLGYNQRSGDADDLQTFPYILTKEGTVSVDDTSMTYFVAEDLEYQIKIASPVSKNGKNNVMWCRVFISANAILSDTSLPNSPTVSTPSQSLQLPRQFLQQSQQMRYEIDSNVLSDLEIEAQYLATTVDNLTENLCNLLHSISSITADNV